MQDSSSLSLLKLLSSSALAILIVCAMACGGGAKQTTNGATGPVPKGPPGVDYRASCEFQQTGICVDVFTDGKVDANGALPAGCTPLNASCIREKVKGLCKLERQTASGRVYSEQIFYSSPAGRQVTETCINHSGRLVRYDY